MLSSNDNKQGLSMSATMEEEVIVSSCSMPKTRRLGFREMARIDMFIYQVNALLMIYLFICQKRSFHALSIGVQCVYTWNFTQTF